MQSLFYALLYMITMTPLCATQKSGDKLLPVSEASYVSKLYELSRASVSHEDKKKIALQGLQYPNPAKKDQLVAYENGGIYILYQLKVPCSNREYTVQVEASSLMRRKQYKFCEIYEDNKKNNRSNTWLFLVDDNGIAWSS